MSNSISGLSFTNLDLFSVGVTVAAIIILGFIVLISQKKSITHQTFFVFSVITVLWSIANYLSYQTTRPEFVLLLSRMVIFLGVWHSFSFFQFFYVFPENNKKFSKFYKFLLVPFVILVSILTLTPYVFSGVSKISEDSPVSQLVVEKGIAIFAGTVVLLLLVGIIIFIRKLIKAKEERKQYRTILIGTIATFALIFTFNLILPAFFDIVRFIPLGALFILPFAVFTSYAIGKHRLLNVKTFAAEIMTFFLAVVTLFELIISGNIWVLLFRLGIFCLVLIFGILLIKSVLREVEQRERLEILSKQLAEANDKLKELDHLKSEFLSFASHQLKAPMAAIKGFATLIYDGTYGDISDKVKEAAIKIRDSADRTVNLVADFLNVRKIEEGKMEYKLERIDGVKMSKDITEELKLLAQNKKLELSFESRIEEAFINADAQRIRQVFQNLIENSIKYTDTGFVKVKTESDSGQFIFSVSDSGHGMSKELLPHLFEEFKRADGTKLIEGTGLGLFIAQEIAKAHKGGIEAESEGVGKGSKFILKIPLA